MRKPSQAPLEEPPRRDPNDPRDPEDQDGREARLTTAAFILAAALFIASWPSEPPGLTPCPRPVEQEAHEGHTRVVRCDGDGPPLRGPARLLFDLTLDPNRADPRTLEALPGIGPARALAIVQARSDRPFTSPSDLLRVPGIGPVTLSRIAPYLSVGEAGLQQNR